MDPDLFLVIGLLIGGFTIPPILGAIFDGRPPRTPAVLVVIAGGMIAFAVIQKPGGYVIQDIPGVFSHVIGKYL
ncbi:MULTISPECIES: hypothetical protein [Falsihalocynthiibacter]|uniref:50S ribosomal protein L35 n=1 Tax=Falsihalocynthiibacter arcticus TaxID=1579316 RepID=A0A126UZ00_9RHOB|nr:hypothetical protein [Falsihalocynthiibacter arcticus]AML51288.1 hypothetical protein RC74_08525 [Falsihalocynthiibacter arcticus]